MKRIFTMQVLLSASIVLFLCINSFASDTTMPEFDGVYIQKSNNTLIELKGVYRGDHRLNMNCYSDNRGYLANCIDYDNYSPNTLNTLNTKEFKYIVTMGGRSAEDAMLMHFVYKRGLFKESDAKGEKIYNTNGRKTIPYKLRQEGSVVTYKPESIEPGKYLFMCNTGRNIMYFPIVVK